jgi:hypothetical protein
MKYLVLTVVCCVSMRLSAQPVLIMEDFAEIEGIQVPVFVAQYYNPGLAIPGFTLDRSNANVGTPSNSFIVDPDGTPYAGSFPACNFASRGLTDTTVFSYGLLNPTGVYSYGRYGPEEHVILNNPELLMKLPLAYGESWSDQWSGAGIIAGLNYSRSGTTTGVYNGHGTLITPFGTFENVARIQVEQRYFDIRPDLEIAYQTTNVYYHINGFNRPLYSSSLGLWDIGEGFEEFLRFSTFVDPSVVGIAENEHQDLAVRLFPNPAEDQVTVTWEARAGSSYHVELLDATGRLIRSLPPVTAVGTTSLSVPVVDLLAGAYLLRIHDGGLTRRVLPVMVQ